MTMWERFPDLTETSETTQSQTLGVRAAELAIGATVTGLRLVMTPLAAAAFAAADRLPNGSSLSLDGVQPTAWRPSVDTPMLLAEIDELIAPQSITQDN